MECLISKGQLTQPFQDCCFAAYATCTGSPTTNAGATLAPDLLGKSCVWCSAGVVVGLPRSGVRVFQLFAWLGVGSVKVALSRPSHKRVTLTVGRTEAESIYANKERGHMEFSILYQELQYSTEMIRALLAGVAPEAARLKPNAESWSILEVVCHLYDEEREDFREHLDFILHRQNEQWHAIDTEGWVTQRNYNEQNFAEMQEKFFVEREKSFAWLKGLQNPDWEQTITTEYRTISAGEMFACWVAHDNLHIRQLVELRRLRLENITKPYSLEYAGDW
jgi:hypothetical protein